METLTTGPGISIFTHSKDITIMVIIEIWCRTSNYKCYRSSKLKHRFDEIALPLQTTNVSISLGKQTFVTNSSMELILIWS